MSEKQQNHDWSRLSPTEMLNHLSNWFGPVSGDDKEFEAGMNALASKKNDLTIQQKNQVQVILTKLDGDMTQRLATKFMNKEDMATLKESEDYKVGDKVRIKNGLNKNKEGKVVSISTYFPFKLLVKNDAGYEIYNDVVKYANDYLEKITESKKMKHIKLFENYIDESEVNQNLVDTR